MNRKFWLDLPAFLVFILFIYSAIYPIFDYPGFVWVVFQYIGMFVVARFLLRYFVFDPMKKRREAREREFNRIYRGIE